jgi:hypothetical protein
MDCLRNFPKINHVYMQAIFGKIGKGLPNKYLRGG